MSVTEPRRPLTLLLAALGGLLTDAAFPQRNLWPLAFVGIALLVLALRRDSARWGFLVGLTWGAVFYLVHLWWVFDSVGGATWVLFSLVLAAYVGLVGAAWAWIRRWPPARRGWVGALAWSALWVALEGVRSIAPFEGFPWARLAFSQTTGPLLRLASLGGTPLVGGIVAGLGFALALVWWRMREGRPGRALVSLGVTVLVPLLCLAVPLGTRAEAGTVTVGAVQGNVPNAGLDAFANARGVIANHVAGTLDLLERAEAEGRSLDVVLWPENAADYDPRTDAQAQAAVTEASEAAGVPILLGTQSYVYGDDGRATARYNDMVRWDPGIGAVAVYAKQHPAPFAEYIPLRDLARRVTSAVDLVTVDMAKGTGPAILPVPVGEREVPFGVAICFEVAYDEIVADSVRDGAEILVVPTNNASFGLTAESEQQLAMTVFRAVEHGRAAVQVSTVGVSGIVWPNGVVSERTELFTPATMLADLPLRTSVTPATNLAPRLQWGAYGVAGLALLLGLVSAGRTRRPDTKGPR
ncbi:apolipoprotein N-acyltransferase [Salana multivorans]|uniref:Apolipoprotein N-acyltransferase n=1 Tax=Salana multivorans TaxID=120377 RepID=A0A3N2D1C0_9MICO|nr:apolipoprotein N-acyltransferase [Salana multivorans]